MKKLQVGITLDEEAVSALVELLSQIVERGTARQTEAVLKLAETLAERVKAPSTHGQEAAITPTIPPVKDTPSKEESGLIDANEVAGLLGVSPRMVWRLRDSGKMPRPTKIGSLVRWPRGLIKNWIEAGCPATERRASGVWRTCQITAPKHRLSDTLPSLI